MLDASEHPFCAGSEPSGGQRAEKLTDRRTAERAGNHEAAGAWLVRFLLRLNKQGAIDVEARG
uniref:Uncharacterized protein n=1 Tax=Thermogemmatispora argillosa TaxID=2045280 RepID=A0A455T730_9CHLR|nr:hypothetical protein KTA_22630 [Thermogemmatispora argillosa]